MLAKYCMKINIEIVSRLYIDFFIYYGSVLFVLAMVSNIVGVTGYKANDEKVINLLIWLYLLGVVVTGIRLIISWKCGLIAGFATSLVLFIIPSAIILWMFMWLLRWLTDGDI